MAWNLTYPIVAQPTNETLEAPPFNLTIYKGHKDAAISRSTAEFLLRSKLAKGFLQWLETGVGFPEEFFFATLRRVSQRLWNKHNIVEQSNETTCAIWYVDSEMTRLFKESHEIVMAKVFFKKFFFFLFQPEIPNQR